MILHKKKYIVEIAGGLGNQMFQYAFYLQFKKKYPNTVLDISSYISDYIHNGYELDKVFGIQPNYCSENDLANINDVNQSLFFKLKRKVFGHRPSIYYEHNKDYSFKPFVFEFKRPVFLRGCWLSEKYFAEVTDEVKKKFTFAPFGDNKNSQLQEIIEKSNSVSIHIRLGDYEKNKIYQNICTPDYYQKAIQYIENRIQNPLFFVFSDEPHLAQSKYSFLNEKNVIIADWNHAGNSFNDMHLMSLCKHNIIANSTFSWWGAWLNCNSGKIVVTPKNWFSEDKFKNIEIIPESWIKIESYS